MYRDWTKHLKDNKKKEVFEEALKHSGLALERLSDILQEYKEDNLLHVSSFDNPNWSHMLASKVGETKAYNRIQDLINSVTKEKLTK